METGTGIVPTMPIGGDGFGMGSGIWIFALLILLFGANGSFFGGNGSRAATVEDLNNSANATRVENLIQNNGNLIETKMDRLTQGLCDMGYTTAQQFAEVNANVTAQVQGIKDMLYENKIETLQNQLNQLNLTSQLSNVVRYPSGYTYTAGNSPFCSCGCGCSGNY